MSWLSEATGIHISPKGVKIEPQKLVTDALALTGNPLAIAGMAGNTIHGITPNSTLGQLGQTGGNIAGTIAMLTGTGGLGSSGGMLGKAGSVFGGAQTIPGTNIPVMSAVQSLTGGMPGGVNPSGGAASGAGAPAASGGSSIYDSIGRMLGIGGSGPGGAMTPDEKLRLLQTGLGTLGGAAGAYMNSKSSAADLAERQREFNTTTAMQAGRYAATAPLRQQAITGMSRGITQPPTPFQPHDIYNPQGYGPSSGQPQYANAAPGAAPAAGNDVYSRLLKMAGYGAAS